MGKKSENLKPSLWTSRPVAETIAVYADWADTYDAELKASGYRTPARLAMALANSAPKDAKVLDFGCGTGIGGLALHKAGFKQIDGTDVTPQMLEKARKANIYDTLWVSSPGAPGFETGRYDAIYAAGVISLGAAPPDTLAPLVARLNPGGFMALSFSDPTLADTSYIDALDKELDDKRADLVFREYGPHLDDIGMGSDVIILRRL